MLKETSSNINRILTLISELDQHLSYKQDLISRTKTLLSRYQRKEFDYFTYEKKLKEILKGKSYKDWVNFYNSQIKSLLGEIEYANAKLYKTVYDDQSYALLKIHKPTFLEKTLAFAVDRVDDVKETGHALKLGLRSFERKEDKRLHKELKDLKHLFKIKLNRLKRVSEKDAEAVMQRIYGVEKSISKKTRAVDEFFSDLRQSGEVFIAKEAGAFENLKRFTKKALTKELEIVSEKTQNIKRFGKRAYHKDVDAIKKSFVSIRNIIKRAYEHNIALHEIEVHRAEGGMKRSAGSITAKDMHEAEKAARHAEKLGKKLAYHEVMILRNAVKAIERFSAKEANALNSFLDDIDKETVSEVSGVFSSIGDWISHKVTRAKRFKTHEANKLHQEIKEIEHKIKLKAGRLSRIVEKEEEIVVSPFARVWAGFKRLFRRRKHKKKLPAAPEVPLAPEAVAPSEAISAAETVSKASFFTRLKQIFTSREKAPEFEGVIAKKNVVLLHELRKPWFERFKDYWNEAFTGKKPIFTGKTVVGKSLLDLERLRQKDVKEAIAKIRPRVLAEEAERVSSILKQKEKITLYRPSTIGAIANLTVRKISLFFINKFPVFFEQLYRNLRLANVRILSNTYANIMFFFSILSFLIGSIFFGFFFMSILKGLVAGVITMALIFTLFYYYPVSEIKTRIRSIRTNMSFAINHMAAVIDSGVTPHEMFSLIAQSKEYGEIEIELEKVVELIDLYGYDLTTALETVAATTPEKSFKEFLDGMVTTISSGGDIKQYLKEKAEAAMSDYELERQKYVETISTYSDIYTGILIAAPLFFVATLALISILGGTVAGLPVETVVTIGTYFIIPLLNLAFIVFLEVTQPTV